MLIVMAAVSFVRPARACSCSEITPVTADDLRRFDAVFSGTAIGTKSSQQHDCTTTIDDVSLSAFEVKVDQVWLGSVSQTEVILVGSDSCAPTVPLDQKIIFFALRQDDGSLLHGGLACSSLPGDDDLDDLLGAPSAPTADDPIPECYSSCAMSGTGFAAMPVLFAALFGRRRRSLIGARGFVNRGDVR